MADITWKIHGTTFVCDANKRLEALKKHHVDFYLASTDFFDSNALFTTIQGIAQMKTDLFLLVRQQML